jgi:hypothetical protein
MCGERPIERFRTAPHHSAMITIPCAALSKKVPVQGFWIEARDRLDGKIERRASVRRLVNAE